MRKATSILLEDDSEAFIDKQIAEGHFSNPSEVIEAGLRLLKDHDDEIEAILGYRGRDEMIHRDDLALTVTVQ